jgi:hypothetical protein
MFAYMGGFLRSWGGAAGQWQLYREKLFHQVLYSRVELPKVKMDEIQHRSKADNIVKTVAVIQTLWFGMQAADRVSRGLDITKLEIITLGHVVINIFVYFFWWNKPSSVRFPIEVYRAKREDKQAPQSGASNNKGLMNKTGQGLESQMLFRPSLPFRVRIATLLGNYERRSENFLRLRVLFLFLFTMSALSGAIYCLAWNSPFPTDTQRLLWRVCALIVTAAPALGILTGLGRDGCGLWESAGGWISISLESLLVLSYFFARIYLLVISLTSDRALPYN